MSSSASFTSSSSASSSSPSSSSSFSAAEDDAMIARVRENAVLFDASHSMYKDGMHKDYIWHQIGTAVGRTPDDCKKRWRNMRNTYKRHRKKSLTLSPHKKQWRLMGRLSFLDSVERDKKAAPNADPPAKEVQSEGVADGEERAEEKGEERAEERAEEEGEATVAVAEAVAEESEATSATTTDGPPSTARARKRARNDGTPTGWTMAAVAAEKCSVRRGACAAPRNGARGRGRGAACAAPDSVDLFFSSVALNVKRLPTRAINKAQMKILSLVAQLEDEYAHPAPFLHHLPPADYRYTDFRCARSPGLTTVAPPPQRDDSPFGPPRYGNNNLCLSYDVFPPK